MVLAPKLPSSLRTGTLIARGDFRPATFDEKTLEVDLVMSSGSAVVRAPWFADPFIEELSMDAKHIRMERLQSGRMPLLNNHSSWSLESMLGKVNGGRLEGGQLVVRACFSDRASIAPIVRDVQRGIICNTSIGYRVYKYQDVTKVDEASAMPKMRTLRAVDWELFECSLVCIPADASAGVRFAAPNMERASEGAMVERASDAYSECNIEGQEASERTMTDLEKAEAARLAREAQAQPAGAAPIATLPDPKEEAQRQATERAIALEQARCLEAQRLGNQFKLDAKWVAAMIADRSKDVAAMQRDALAELAKRSNDGTGPSHVEVGADPADKVRDGVTDALMHRLGITDKLTAAGHDFRHRGIRRMAEEVLQARGVPVNRLSVSELAFVALHGATGRHDDPTRGLQGTSDFAQLLSNVQNKAMRKKYEGTRQTWLPLARRNIAQDFKPMRRIQISGGTGLKRLNEHGEVERGSVSDQAENYSINTEALIVGFTRQSFINDDLGEFQRTTERMGTRAADRRSDLVWSMISGTTLMADGFAVFSTQHKNIHVAGGTGVLSESSLTDAIVAIGSQTDTDGNRLSIRPAFLVVPLALWIPARKFTTSVTPAQTSNVNVFDKMFDDVFYEPRLDAVSTTAWYLFGSKDQIDVIEYSELAGSNGPDTMIRNGFDVDGIEFRITDDFGAAFLESVSSYKSPGA